VYTLCNSTRLLNIPLPTRSVLCTFRGIFVFSNIYIYCFLREFFKTRSFERNTTILYVKRAATAITTPCTYRLTNSAVFKNSIKLVYTSISNTKICNDDVCDVDSTFFSLYYTVITVYVEKNEFRFRYDCYWQKKRRHYMSRTKNRKYEKRFYARDALYIMYVI